MRQGSPSLRPALPGLEPGAARQDRSAPARPASRRGLTAPCGRRRHPHHPVDARTRKRAADAAVSQRHGRGTSARVGSELAKSRGLKLVGGGGPPRDCPQIVTSAAELGPAPSASQAQIDPLSETASLVTTTISEETGEMVRPRHLGCHGISTVDSPARRGPGTRGVAGFLQPHPSRSIRRLMDASGIVGRSSWGHRVRRERPSGCANDARPAIDAWSDVGTQWWFSRCPTGFGPRASQSRHRLVLVSKTLQDKSDIGPHDPRKRIEHLPLLLRRE